MPNGIELPDKLGNPHPNSKHSRPKTTQYFTKLYHFVTSITIMMKLLTILLLTANLFLASSFTVKVSSKPLVSNIGTNSKNSSYGDAIMSALSTEKTNPNAKVNVDESSGLTSTSAPSHPNSSSNKVVMLSDECGPGCTCSRCMFGM